MEIGKVRPLARPVAVIGSTAEDFALAVALDRMYGAVIWLPIEWLQNEALRWPMAMGLYNLVNTARPSGNPPVVTSISLSLDELETFVKNHWRPPGLAIQDANGQLQAVDKPPQIVPAQHLDLGLPEASRMRRIEPALFLSNLNESGWPCGGYCLCWRLFLIFMSV